MNTGQVAQQLRMLTQQLSRTFQSTAQPKYTQVFLFRMFHILRCLCGVKIAHARPTINLPEILGSFSSLSRGTRPCGSVLTEEWNAGQSIFTCLLHFQLQEQFHSDEERVTLVTEHISAVIWHWHTHARVHTHTCTQVGVIESVRPLHCHCLGSVVLKINRDVNCEEARN